MCRMKIWCTCCVNHKTQARVNRSWIQWKLSKLEGNYRTKHTKQPEKKPEKTWRGAEAEERGKEKNNKEKKNTTEQQTKQTKTKAPNKKHHCQPVAAEKDRGCWPSMYKPSTCRSCFVSRTQYSRFGHSANKESNNNHQQAPKHRQTPKKPIETSRKKANGNKQQNQSRSIHLVRLIAS